MVAHLPKEALDALHDAQKRKNRPQGRLCVHVGDKVHPVLALWDTGFVVSENIRNLRGYVALYDGPRHLADCLIVRAESDPRGARYEYKRRNLPDAGTTVDYDRKRNAPRALLPSS